MTRALALPPACTLAAPVSFVTVRFLAPCQTHAVSEWTCEACGREHPGLAYVLGAPEPYPWEVATDEQRAAGGCTDDTCVLPTADGVEFYVRAHLEIPILPPGSAEADVFVWSVWSSLSEASYDLLGRTWDDPERVNLPPLPGWLSSALPYEPTTLGLRSRVVFREPGVVPLSELDPSQDHPLVHEIRQGISLHRVHELNREAFG